MTLRVRPLLLLAAVAAASSAQARTPYGAAGCGLGSLIFEPETCQTSAATTNGTLFNQGFGITFGTSNCVGGGSKKLVENVQKQFMGDNYTTLAKEMAQGDGQTLLAFSTMFGCDHSSYPAFAKEMQSAYGEIFAAPGAGASVDVIRHQIKASPQLATRCSEVI